MSPDLVAEATLLTEAETLRLLEPGPAPVVTVAGPSVPIVRVIDRDSLACEYEAGLEVGYQRGLRAAGEPWVAVFFFAVGFGAGFLAAAAWLGHVR